MDAVDPAVYHMATSSTGPGHIIKFFTNFKFSAAAGDCCVIMLVDGQFWSKMCQRSPARPQTGPGRSAALPGYL